jgi:DeoR/GlpR family transcriptional regulator of sugar metabolism
MNKHKSLDKIPMRRNEPGEIVMPRGLYITTKISEESITKHLIAKYVVDNYIHDFDAVLLDAGSTAEIIAEEMFARRKFLSVLTNNMGAYAAYTRAREQIEPYNDEKNPPNHGNELLISGGRYVDVYESLLGEGAMASFSNFTPNVIIIGTSGLRCEEGIFCHGSEESAVKQLLWTKMTDTRLIATDWTKIGKRDARSFGPISQLCINAKKAVIVTNEPPKDLYDSDPDRIREFENQLKKMEKDFNIIVERVPLQMKE